MLITHEGRLTDMRLMEVEPYAQKENRWDLVTPMVLGAEEEKQC